MKIVECFFAVGRPLTVADSGIPDDSTSVYIEQVCTFFVSQRLNEIGRHTFEIVEEIRFDAARVHRERRAKVVSLQHRVTMYHRRTVKTWNPQGVKVVANLSRGSSKIEIALQSIAILPRKPIEYANGERIAHSHRQIEFLTEQSPTKQFPAEEFAVACSQLVVDLHEGG